MTDVPLTSANRSHKPITSRQRAILAYIVAYVDRRGAPPTIREIGIHCGIGSTSLVSFYLGRLVDDGLIARTAIVSRGIVVTAAGRAAVGAVTPAERVLASVREAVAEGEALPERVARALEAVPA